MADDFQVFAGFQSRIYIHVHKFRQRAGFAVFAGVFYAFGLAGIAGAAAFRAGNFDIGQKLYVKIYDAGSVTDRAAQFSGVVREISGFETLLPGGVGFGKDFAQLVVNIGVGCHGGADVDADGGGVNEFYLFYARGIDGYDMRRQFFVINGGFKRRNQTLKDQGGFAGAGNAGYNGQPAFGNVYIQRFNGVDGTGGKVDGAEGEYLVFVVF